MADFLTENPDDSDVPSEAVAWKPVDDTETELEQKMKELSTKPKREEEEVVPTTVLKQTFRLSQKRWLSNNLCWGKTLPQQMLQRMPPLQISADVFVVNNFT